MIRQDGSDPTPQQRLRHELDDIAGLADALAIVSDNGGDRCSAQTRCPGVSMRFAPRSMRR